MDNDVDVKPSSVSYHLVSNTYQLVKLDGDNPSELNGHRPPSDEGSQNSQYICKFCELHFSEEDQLKLHVQIHSGSKPFVCINCQMTFSRRSSMLNHKKLNLCHDAYKYICDLCGERFLQSCELESHSLTHTDKVNGVESVKSERVISKEPKYIFLETRNHTNSGQGQVTKLEKRRKSRVSRNTSEEVKNKRASPKGKDVSNCKCKFCDLQFDTADELLTHVASHSGSKPFLCTQCGQTFTERSSMLTHKKLHLGPTAYRYECDLCGRKFARGATLNRHKRAHTGERPYPCDLCQKSFATKYTLNTHTKTVHFNVKHKRAYKKRRVAIYVPIDSSQKETAHSKDNLLSCDKCGKVFSWNSTLVSHKVRQHGFRPYQCEVCGKTFPRKSVLRFHMFAHSNYRPHICEECGKRCSTKSSLNWHKKSHSHVRPFGCNICGKYFKMKGAAVTHRKIHQSSREMLECTICSKSYATKHGLDLHNLRLHSSEEERKKKLLKCQWCPFVCYDRNYIQRHAVTHTGQRDHMCEVCGRAFSFEYSLKRHRLMHVSARNFQCTMCDKSFFIVYDLHRHMRMHSDERPYQCEHCAENFKTPYCLNKHIKRCHTKNITIFVY